MKAEEAKLRSLENINRTFFRNEIINDIGRACSVGKFELLVEALTSYGMPQAMIKEDIEFFQDLGYKLKIGTPRYNGYINCVINWED